MDAITFVDVVCARAATVGEDGVGDARWRPAVKAVESGGGAASGFPSLAARPLDRIRVRVLVGSSAQVNLVIRAAGPHLFL